MNRIADVFENGGDLRWVSKIKIGSNIILEVKWINKNGIHCTSYIEKQLTTKNGNQNEKSHTYCTR